MSSSDALELYGAMPDKYPGAQHQGALWFEARGVCRGGLPASPSRSPCWYSTWEAGSPLPTRPPGEAPRYAGLRAELTELLDRSWPAWRMRPDDLLFESGRALAATCGVLHTAVVDGRQTKPR